jgi:hypothetical protein
MNAIAGVVPSYEAFGTWRVATADAAVSAPGVLRPPPPGPPPAIGVLEIVLDEAGIAVVARAGPPPGAEGEGVDRG